MSKPISISLGKPKAKASPVSHTSTPPCATTPIPPPRRPAFTTADAEEDGEDERPPAHEPMLGFSADGGAILRRPVKTQEERVIENKGNADWRTRGRPAKGTSLREAALEVGAGTLVEKEKTSKKAGLQFAEKNATTTITSNGHSHNGHPDPTQQPENVPRSADEAALSALLNTAKAKPSSTTTIPQSQTSTSGSTATTGDEVLDFRTDVASRPNPSTLSEYVAMPVEEFGMALLRGMGKKRRANGEVIVIKNPNEEPDDEDKKREREKKRLRDPNMGYLGIGAKAVKIGSGGGGGGGSEDGLGAWGKADMRGKNRKSGEGAVMYTPVMLRDRRTGELISERELEERKRVAKEAAAARGKRNSKTEEDWRERRDRNLDRNGIGSGAGAARRGNDEKDDGDNYDYEHRDKQLNELSRRKMIEDSSRDASRHTSPSSRRRKSRSRDRDRDRDREEKHRNRDRDRDRRRGRHGDGDDRPYDSSSSSSRRHGSGLHGAGYGDGGSQGGRSERRS